LFVKDFIVNIPDPNMSQVYGIYVAAHVFFDSDGYGIIVWAARQPDYDPRKIK
jgi:hypothetical protein